MPAYSTMKAFVMAINTGRTHITESLDAFFSDPARVKNHSNWTDLSTGNWSSGPPPWLGQVLGAPVPNDGVGLTGPETAHVLAWPLPELEKARDAAVRAVRGTGVVPPKAPRFFWVLYPGTTPRTIERVSSAGDPEIVFQSPRAAVVMEGDEVFVRDVDLGRG
ncbi:MAG TPA: hypothetical protein VFO59_02640 [Dehalococcoidia bacterium]|nr:hypothetical protein [Dehalococcoidia bacterium]